MGGRHRPGRLLLFQAEGPEGKVHYSSYRSKNSGGSEQYDSTLAFTLTVLTGAQYMFGPRFAVFAGLGLGYAHTTDKEKFWNDAGTLTSDRTLKNSLFFLRLPILGVIFYLN